MSEKRYLSLQEWLQQEKGVVALDKGRMISLGRLVSEQYKYYRGTDKVTKDYRIVNGNTSLVAVYSEQDFPILTLAFVKLMCDL